MRLTGKVLLTLAALVLATASNAQPRPGGGGPIPGPGPSPGPGPGSSSGQLTKVTVEQMAQLFGSAGFQAQVVQNGNLKMVRAVFWTADIFGGAIPEACEKDGSGCHAMKVFANLGKATVDQNWINGWNNTWLYVRCSIAGGNLIFAYDIGLFTGVSPEYIVTGIKLFKAIVDKSTDFKP